MIKYHISSRIIHWLMALIIIITLLLGIYMTKFLPKDATNLIEIYNLHKSFGVMALIFIVIRIINRFIHKAPQTPEGFNKIEKFAAHFIHILLYILMIFVPFSGYLMSNFYGFPVHIFSYKMPIIVSNNLQFGAIFLNIHEILAYSLLAAIIFHILGALKHNDILKRII
ncbi:MAG TPA: cytochrome b/b6 domain-containing protein [Rickettsiales bacterium]|nr:cytochrome b/b6 domain-containing protein [Rickettsiales bacterium]